MKKGYSPLMIIIFGIVIGAFSIVLVVGRSSIRTVDVIQLFAGGLITGAAIITGLRNKADEVKAKQAQQSRKK